MKKQKQKRFTAAAKQPTALQPGVRQFPELGGGGSISESEPGAGANPVPADTHGGPSSAVETDGKPRTKNALICFDRDIAELCGVNAALLVKYVECSLRGKHEKNPNTGHWMWNPRSEIAQELSLSVDQLETAAVKAREAKTLCIRRNQHHDKTNRVLFYAVVDGPAFFESRSRAVRYWMRRDEFVALGACAAVLLHSFRFWQNQNVTVESALFDGRTWHHDDLEGLTEVYKGLFTARQIEDTLNHLVKIERLLRRPYDPNNRRNRRRWFAVNDPPKSAPSTGGNSATEDLKTRGESEARQIPNGSASNPNSEYVESQLHNTYVPGTDALRADLAPLGPHSVEPRTNDTLRERPAVAPQAVGDVFQTSTTEAEEKTEAINIKQKKNPHQKETGKQTTVADSDEEKDSVSATDSEDVQRGLKEPQATVSVDVAERFNPVEVTSGRKAVDLRYDNLHEKQIGEDREGNVRQTFASCHQEVFGCAPAHGLGSARQVLEAAHALAIPVRLYCLLSMVSWSFTHPDKPFASHYLVGDGAIKRIKLWIKMCLEKFVAVDEHFMGLLVGLKEVDGRVDWRQPKHPYKSILRHWEHEYRRWSEADYEADQSGIDTVVRWLLDNAPLAPTPARLVEAHPKLREVFELITLNFQVTKVPYATLDEFFYSYDDLKERLAGELRRYRNRLELRAKDRSESSVKRGSKRQGTVDHADARTPSTQPTGRRAGAPIPPPTPRQQVKDPDLSKSQPTGRRAGAPVPPPTPRQQWREPDLSTSRPTGRRAGAPIPPPTKPGQILVDSEPAQNIAARQAKLEEDERQRQIMRQARREKAEAEAQAKAQAKAQAEAQAKVAREQAQSEHNRIYLERIEQAYQERKREVDRLIAQGR